MPVKFRIVLFVFFLSTFSSIAHSIDIQLIGFESEKYRDIKKSIEKNNESIIQRYENRQKNIAIIFNKDNHKEEYDFSKFDLVVYFYINNYQYQNIKSINTSAIISGQPIHRQILLATSINKESKRLSIPWTQHYQKINIDHQKNIFINIKWNTPKIEIEKNQQSAISKSLHNADALIAIDDNDIYNANTLRSILLSAYRLRKPMIGPGPAFVKAGAMASVYSHLDDYLNELSDLIVEFIETEKTPDSRWPSRFDVMINDNVARSLGYLDLNRERVLNDIKAAEKNIIGAQP